ncbi:carnosine N-methyltransferase [[Candida] anglica]
MAEPDLEEYKALTSTLSSFYHYGRWAHNELISPRRVKISSLTEQDLKLIPWYPKHIDDLEQCLRMNEDFTRTLALTIAQDWGAPTDPSQWASCTPQDFEKVRSILLQLSREWSDDGEVERQISFTKIIDQVCKLYPDLPTRQKCKILVPGCGTGRLVFELVKQGFWCQGNEFSYHMLLASNYVLNHSFVAHNHSIFPFIHKFSHLTKRVNQLRPITIPNINPGEIAQLEQSMPEIPYCELMSMAAGSFVDLYGPENMGEVSDTYSEDAQANEFRTENAANFDVVVTCFFLDTSLNIIDYIKTISHSLKPGAVWINFGPLLWHFEDDGNMSYIKRLSADGKRDIVPTARKGLELSRDDLLSLVEKMGFVFEKHESGISTPYCSDPRSLGGFEYKCEFWVARKT